MNHIMIDLEMNKIDKQQRGDIKLSSELIEIGAVKMDDQFEVIDQYQTYVAPDYGAMDHRIIALTGITDDKLVGAPRFAKAMDDFAEWIGSEPGFILGVCRISGSFRRNRHLRSTRDRSLPVWRVIGRTFKKYIVSC